MLSICALSSGSSGNAIFVGNGKTNILMDAGISARELARRMTCIGEKPEKLSGIFITHEHTDHIRGLRVFANRFQIPVYATEETWYYLGSQCIPFSQQRIVLPNEALAINDFEVEAFPVPHDAADPVGYTIKANSTTVGIVTDLGHIPSYLQGRLAGVQLLFLEANHDEDVLKEGKYPAFLKQRILGKRGHISNNTAGDLLTALAKGCLHSVMLGHLSKNNNTPELALSSVTAKLESVGCRTGKDIAVRCCHHGQMSEKVTL